MSEPTIETVRAWLIEAKVGLIEQSELIRRVDELLGTLKEAPSALVAISMQEGTTWSGRLDLVLHRPTDSDAAILAQRLLMLLRTGELAWDCLEEIAFSAGHLVPDSEYSQGQFKTIAEDLYVSRECGTSVADAIKEAESRLESIVRLAVGET